MHLKLCLLGLMFSSTAVSAGVNTVLKSIEISKQEPVNKPEQISNYEITVLDETYSTENSISKSSTPKNIQLAFASSVSGADIVEPSTDHVLSKDAIDDSQSLPSINGRLTRYADGKVEFRLSRGLLKPQVEELLMNHERVDGLDDINWKASSNFMWPNDFTLSADSLDEALNRLLKPYKLEAIFKVNVIEISVM